MREDLVVGSGIRVDVMGSPPEAVVSVRENVRIFKIRSQSSTDQNSRTFIFASAEDSIAYARLNADVLRDVVGFATAQAC